MICAIIETDKQNGNKMKLDSKLQKIWFTSDLHLFHKNILKFNPNTRSGENEFEMSSTLIHNYNNVVGENDIVFMLGDISFGKLENTLYATSLLNGKKHLVLGNHDKIILNNMDKFNNVFESIQQYKHIYVNDQKIVLMHYPIESWDGQHYGSFHLHGHCHGSIKQAKNLRRLDVGVDNRTDNLMIPFSFEYIFEMLSTKSFRHQEEKQ